MSTDAFHTRSVALGDVDGDGDLDMVSGNFYSHNRLYTNDGAGVFTTAPMNASEPYLYTQSINLGDIDGDGD